MPSEGGAILTWNMANWITVIIMAGIGFAILGTLMKMYQKRMSGG